MATFTAGEIVWKVIGDASGFKKTADEAEKKAKSSGSIIEKAFKKVGVAVAAAFTADKIIQFGKSLIKASSDAAETAQKFGVVFTGIQAEANRTAQEVASAYNISNVAAKELLANTGNVLQSFGFTKEKSLELSASLNGLAADITSFSNYQGGAAEAGRILTKALLGERDALGALGLDIRQKELENYAKAQGKVFANLSSTEQAQITYNVLIEKTKNQVGDTARSIDTYAYSVRSVQKAQEDFAAASGQKLLPIMTKLNNAWAEFLNILAPVDTTRAVRSLEEENQSLIRKKNILKDLNNQIEETRKSDEGFFAKRSKIKELEDEKKAIEELIEANQKQYDKALENSKKEIAKPKAKEDPAVTAQRQQAAKDAEADRQRRIDGQKQTNIDLLNAKADYYKQLNQVSDIAATDYLMNLKNQQSAELEALKETLKLEGEARLEAGTATQAQLDTLAELSINKLLQSQQKQTSDYVAGMEKQEEATISFAEQVQKISEIFNVVFNSVSSVLSAIDNLQQANYDKESDRLDEQMNAEIAAANATEETAVEKAQKEYDLAVSSGNNDTIIEKKKALDRIKIEEDYAKKKRKLDYEAALSAWETQVALASIQVAQAPLNAFASTMGINPVLAAGAAAAAAIAAGIQMAAVVAAKPQPPKFANGGIVPGTSFSGDKVNANVNSGEMILNGDQQRKLFDIANGATGGGQIVLNNYIGTEKIGTVLYKMSQNGELILDSRAVR